MIHRRFGPIAALLCFAISTGAAAQQDQAAPRYMDPPPPIAQILDTPPTPLPSVSPRRDRIALLGRANLPPIAELAEPDLRLAGYRINPRNWGPANSRIGWLNALSFQDVATRATRQVRLPAGSRFTSPSWSPDGAQLAFLRDVEQGLELWVADAATGQARRLLGPVVNAVAGGGIEWLPDSSAMLVRTRVQTGAAPAAPRAPSGPIVQENAGRTAPVRTFQDLLRNAADEAQFAHYFTSRLTLVPLNGRARALGAPGIILGASVSPNGRYILQTRAKRPFSYAVPAALFPTEVIVTDLDGRTVRQVADLPLRDDIPPQFDAVAPGPRSVHWRADRPDTLVWVEAQDGGDVRRQAAVRDRVFMLPAPFTARPIPLIDLADRYSGILWGNDATALVFSRWWNDRRETRFAVNPSRPGQGRELLRRNFQDRYNDPGAPVMRFNAQGRPVMHFTPDGQGVLHDRRRRSPRRGVPVPRPIEPGHRRQLSVSGGPRCLTTSPWSACSTTMASACSPGARAEPIRRTCSCAPARAVAQPVQLTDFPDPAPQLAGVTRELITYTRADGVQLSGTLYLPAGYDRERDGPLPLLMWAYPAEFTDAAVAGQVVDTANRFVRPGRHPATCSC